MSIKICQLLPQLLLAESGTVIGAAAKNCLSLAMELRNRGADVTVLAPVGQEKRKALASSHNLAQIVRPLANDRMGLTGRGANAIRTIHRELRRLLREKHFDIVHSHSGTYPYAVLPLVADRNRTVRLHSLYCPFRAKGGVFGSWWESPAIGRRLFSRLDRIVALTTHISQSIEQIGVATERIESIGMCVDTSRFYPREPKGPSRYFAQDQRTTNLLFIGNASVEKGFAAILEAVRILHNKQIPVSLVATIENQSGISEYKARYRQAQVFLREAGIEKCVTLLGIVDTIEDLFLESDIVVSPWNTSRGPSDYPMVALEAMAMGKCVVSTPMRGCIELLDNGRAGILSSGFSARAIAAAIELAIRNPEIRLRVIKEALRKANTLSLTNITQQWLDLYKRLMAGKETQ